MTVHVGEIHTDVVTVPGATGERASPPPRLGAAREAWRELRWELRRDTCRTAAEDFDD